MEIYSTIYLIASVLSIIFLAWRCITLTKALSFYYNLVVNLVDDKLTKENVKVIMSVMYHIPLDELERRLSDEP